MEGLYHNRTDFYVACQVFKKFNNREPTKYLILNKLFKFCMKTTASNDVTIKIIGVERNINNKANFPLFICMVCDFWCITAPKKFFSSLKFVNTISEKYLMNDNDETEENMQQILRTFIVGLFYSCIESKTIKLFSCVYRDVRLGKVNKNRYFKSRFLN